MTTQTIVQGDTMKTPQWHANLAALRESQPDVAALIEGHETAASWVAETARDGSATFVRGGDVHVSGNHAERVWLGRTTMPDVRGRALAKAFEPGRGNALLVGISHGSVLYRLLERMARPQAVMVLEEDVESLCLALRLHDFSESIRSGRLLISAGATCWDDLVELLTDRLGYLAPDRLLTWPWFSNAQTAALTDRLSNTVQEIQNRRDARTARLVAGNSGTVDLAIVTTDAWGGGAGLARSLARAAAAEHREHVAVIADRADARHPARLAADLNGRRPNFCLAVNGTRRNLSTVLKHDVAITVWLTDSVELNAEIVSQIAVQDRLIVSNESCVKQATSMGMDAGRVLYLPVAADAEVAVVSAPRPLPLDAEPNGFHHISHKALWDAVVKQARRQFAQRGACDAPDRLLSDAGTSTGIRLTSDEVRKAIVDRIRTRLVSAVKIEALLKVWEGVSPDPLHGPILMVPQGSAVSSGLLNAALSGRPLFVHVEPPSGNAATAAAGSSHSAWMRLIISNEHVNTFTTPAELAAALQEYRRQPMPFTRRAEAAKAHVAATHLYTHRLAAALAWIAA